MLHMDLQGPFNQSISSFLYVLTVVDNHSQKGFKKYLKHKSDASTKIIDLITWLKTQTSCKIKYVQSDSGGEFVNSELKNWFCMKDITHQKSTPWTS